MILLFVVKYVLNLIVVNKVVKTIMKNGAKNVKIILLILQIEVAKDVLEDKMLFQMLQMNGELVVNVMKFLLKMEENGMNQKKAKNFILIF